MRIWKRSTIFEILNLSRDEQTIFGYLDQHCQDGLDDFANARIYGGRIESVVMLTGYPGKDKDVLNALHHDASLLKKYYDRYVADIKPRIDDLRASQVLAHILLRNQ